MEPENSVLCSEDTAVGIYSEPSEINLCPHTLFLQGTFECYLLIYA
jgi:hypothetical protein